MRSVNIDIKKLISFAVANSLISVGEINESLTPEYTEQEKTNKMTTPVGFSRDEHGHFYGLFVATDRDTGAVRRSRDEKRVKFNVRSSQAPKRQQAQTPGQVVGEPDAAAAQAALANMTPEQIQALQALAAAGETPAPAEVVGQPEQSFAEVGQQVGTDQGEEPPIG